MANFTGTDGNDNIVGTADDDSFDLSQGGNDTAQGLGGFDVFLMGGTLNAADKIDGGDGVDTIVLDGDYSAGLTFNDTTVTNVERFEFSVGHSYAITIAADTFGQGTGWYGVIDAGGLGVNDSIHFDGSAAVNMQLDMIDGAGDDVFIGGSGGGPESNFYMRNGGSDTVIAGTGWNYVYLYGHLDASDKIVGSNPDLIQVFLEGDYSKGVNFTDTTMQNVNYVFLQGEHSYKFSITDAIVAAGRTMIFDGEYLTAGHSFHFDGTANIDGNLDIRGGAGDDVLKGGEGNDKISGGSNGGDGVDSLFGEGGDDFLILGSTKGGKMVGGDGNDIMDSFLGGKVVADGDGGDDSVFLGNSLTKASRINGGDGTDTVYLFGDYAHLKLGNATVTGMEVFNLSNGTFSIVTANGTVAQGQTLTVDASMATTLVFDGSMEKDGNFHLIGSNGNDVLIGGNKADTIIGGLGADHLVGGGGADTFVYGGATESTSSGFDVIDGFNMHVDKIDLWFEVSGIDAQVEHGSLSSGTFDADLQRALGASQLNAHYAVLFSPDGGSFAGDTFLVVDANGIAGYQAGQDLVFELDHGHHLMALTTAVFS